MTILKQDFRPIGEIRNREVRVWRLNSRNGAFYPIFKFKLNRDGGLIAISDQLNPVGKVIFIFCCFLFSIPWLFWIFDDPDFSSHWMQILGWVVFLGIFILIGFKLYRIERQIQLNQIYELLGMEIAHSVSENEWSWKKILTRLIIYPLSFLLVVICIFFAIPSKRYFLVLIILSIIGAYLYADIKLILKKKKINKTRRNH